MRDRVLQSGLLRSFYQRKRIKQVGKGISVKVWSVFISKQLEEAEFFQVR
jgi:hypothetical protein